MQHRAHHQRVGHADKLRTHRPLRFQGVGNYFRQRTVVANRPREHETGFLAHTLVHHALAEDAFGHGRRDAAGRADRIDRAHMVLVPFLGHRPFAQINAERRAVERVLNVVRGERVAGKEQVHVTPGDQFLQMLSGTGVNDGRPADDQDFSTGPFCLAKLFRHLANDCALGLLARDAARHEFERIG